MSDQPATPDPENPEPAPPEPTAPSDPAPPVETAEPAASVEQTAEPAAPVEPAAYRLRRAPRYLPFGVTGAGVGVLAGIVLALSFSASSQYSIETIAGYFAAILGLIGAAAGLGAAVLIERRR